MPPFRRAEQLVQLFLTLRCASDPPLIRLWSAGYPSPPTPLLPPGASYRIVFASVRRFWQELVNEHDHYMAPVVNGLQAAIILGLSDYSGSVSRTGIFGEAPVLGSSLNKRPVS